jgi:mono/diheme cytochrome c family protein
VGAGTEEVDGGPGAIYIKSLRKNQMTLCGNSKQQMSSCLVLMLILISGCHRDSRVSAPKSIAEQKKTFQPRALRDVVYEQTSARLARGEYLTEGLLQCFICHSDRDWNKPGAPPAANKKGAGHIWEDRSWLVAPNITPDKETGAGTWTDDMFARAIREGISHDGRVLHPQMWYGSFRSLSDEDLASIIVYLRTLPPVHNPLPKTNIPEERKRSLEVPEPLLDPVPQPDGSDAVKRGAYLARVADCAGCHTAWEAPLIPGFYAGGNLIERGKEKIFSSNLTPDPSGISYYDDALFINALRTGHVKARKLSSIMPWIAFRNLNDDDLKNLFAYLRARRPVHHVVDNTEPPTECPACGQKHGYGDRNSKKTAVAVSVDPNTYDAYVGRYRFEDGFTLRIAREGNKLFIQFGGDNNRIELVPISATEFTAVDIPDVISFVRNAQGQVTHLLSNVDEVGKKIE